MRLEQVPIVIGVVVGLLGIGFIVDSRLPDGIAPQRERRRRVRRRQHRGGEALVGVGMLAIAASLIGRDTWRYGTLAMLVGAACALIGAFLNRTFVREFLLFRGSARRAEHAHEEPPVEREVPRADAAVADRAGVSLSDAQHHAPANPRDHDPGRSARW